MLTVFLHRVMSPDGVSYISVQLSQWVSGVQSPQACSLCLGLGCLHGWQVAWPKQSWVPLVVSVGRAWWWIRCLLHWSPLAYSGLSMYLMLYIVSPNTRCHRAGFWVRHPLVSLEVLFLDSWVDRMVFFLCVLCKFVLVRPFWWSLLATV